MTQGRVVLGPLYTKRQRQRCKNATMVPVNVFIEYNGVTPDWDCKPFSSDSIAFNENNITSIIAE